MLEDEKGTLYHHYHLGFATRILRSRELPKATSLCLQSDVRVVSEEISSRGRRRRGMVHEPKGTVMTQVGEHVESTHTKHVAEQRLEFPMTCGHARGRRIDVLTVSKPVRDGVSQQEPPGGIVVVVVVDIVRQHGHNFETAQGVTVPVKGFVVRLQEGRLEGLNGVLRGSGRHAPQGYLDGGIAVIACFVHELFRETRRCRIRDEKKGTVRGGCKGVRGRTEHPTESRLRVQVRPIPLRGQGVVVVVVLLFFSGRVADAVVGVVETAYYERGNGIMETSSV